MDQFESDLVAARAPLFAYAITLTRNRDRAEDLTQTAMVRALRARHQFDPGTNFRAWMYTILRNEFLSGARRRPRETTDIDDLPEHVVANRETQHGAYTAARIYESIGALPPSFAWLLIALDEGLNYEEMAVLVGGVSIGTVKSRLWRARNMLAERLETA